MRTKSITVALACLVLVATVAPAAAADGSLAVGVDQDDGGGATVTVTHNDTAVENATVDVEAIDGNYSDEDTHTTDANGTVSLDAPEENVTIDVVATFNNTTAETTAELTVADEGTETGTFGARVSAYVHKLLDGADDREQIGRSIADWVVANNPGNAPDHAGPPEDRGPAAAGGANDRGPGETAGNSSVAAGASGGHPGNGNGPPEDRGPNGK